MSVEDRIMKVSSERVAHIRTEEVDLDWRQRSATRLEAAITRSRGASNITSLLSMGHVGISPTLDVRDPKAPKVVAPGGIMVSLQDWIDFPAFVTEASTEWGYDQFLYLAQSRTEDWNFRITREDLESHHLTLLDFLTPIHSELKKDASFVSIVALHAESGKQVRSAIAVVKERIADPKQLRDLTEF